MRLQVNGYIIDTTDEEVIVHVEGKKTSDMPVEGYSVDFDVPLTQNNVKAFNVWGLLDRGQLYGNYLSGVITGNTLTVNCICQVVGINANSLTIRCYVNQSICELLKKKVVDVLTLGPEFVFAPWSLPDNSGPWEYLFAGEEGATSGYYRYEFAPDILGVSGYTQNVVAQPAVTVQAVLDNIALNTGVSMPEVADLMLIGCSSQDEVTFWNTMKPIFADPWGATQWDDDEAFVNSGGGWLQTQQPVQAAFKLWLDPVVANATWKVKIYRYIDTFHVDILTYSIGVNNDAANPLVLTLNLQSGDEIYFIPDNFTGTTYSNIYGEVETNLTIGQGEDAESNLFSILPSFGDITVGTLLKSLQWVTGMLLSFSSSGVALGDSPTIKAVTAEITRYSPYTDKVGRSTTATYTDETVPTTLTFVGDVFADEVTIYEAPFYGCENSEQGCAVAHRYTLDNAPDDYTEDELPAMPLVVRNGTDLTASPTLNVWPFSAMNGVCEITGYTYEDITGVDVIEVHGRQYYVVEADIDADTGRCEFTALKLK